MQRMSTAMLSDESELRYHRPIIAAVVIGCRSVAEVQCGVGAFEIGQHDPVHQIRRDLDVAVHVGGNLENEVQPVDAQRLSGGKRQQQFKIVA